MRTSAVYLIFKRSRGHEVRGRTGMWLLSSEPKVQSTDLSDHFAYLSKVLEARHGLAVDKLRSVMEGE
jgi:hypothetical protein